MEFGFFKYQGTGNDFVILDNRLQVFPKNNTKLVAQLCDRKFGIGADGLILLEKHPTAHFTMVYYNADGNPSSMCGNGGRCITHFAKYLNIIDKKAVFEAVDGMHEATIDNDIVSLKMNNVPFVSVADGYTFLDTGSPHHVQIVSNLDTFNVFSEGRRLRNDLYGKEGANVNFVEAIKDDIFAVRTYERGVEDETLSCGTGVTAVAIALFETGIASANKVQLQTPGGILTVTFTKTSSGYENIYLIGPAVQVYKGTWS
ncbi:diaminopimelate epimerase [Ulvibacter sp. MAR_2010_11]|uniref:diaminopimelate epimerase n=1 Tax=Ulvibacter sp. MAR_2010_11 TaxID=1250229 RepID=UPI000C2C0AA3|nr:diaminopimelate epimerase [Ulvibacter sp. MAR_2010_11]PKA81915.1 diaminopimelate epimerase [Ulvibacter sp. MAR_2010_11]